MKKLFAGLALAFAFAVTGCTASPEVGQEAVLVQKPIIFGHGGVVDKPVKTGLSFIAPTTTAIMVNVNPVEWRVPFNDLMTSNGVPMHFDAALVLQVTDSVNLIKNFGPNWFENNVDSAYRELVRQSVRKHGMNEVAIDTTAIIAIDREVNSGLKAYLKRSKIPVKLVRTTVGKANPPDSVKDQRVATAQEEQRVLTEQKKQMAEVARKQSELARADADNAYRSAMNLSPEQFVALEKIKANRETISAACNDNKIKCTLFVGGDAIYAAR